MLGAEVDALSTDTDGIRDWRAIVTLIIFVLTNINVLAPFNVPFPQSWSNFIRYCLTRLRITKPRVDQHESAATKTSPPAITVDESALEKDIQRQGSDSASGRLSDPRPAGVNDSGGARPGSAAGAGAGAGPDAAPAIADSGRKSGSTKFKDTRIKFPMNFVTAPIIADLFLLAIGAIGRKEVSQGTLGANNISPLDIMLFFITLAYIAISIDASGLIRWLAFKVLEKGRGNGRRLFLYLYAFFFGLTTGIGNDPVILSGTAFLAYMTRAAKNMPPDAWIFSQFAAANIGSAILVSSNPTNLVLAGAFQIKFIHYTANMVVPTLITAVVLFPFLQYFVFNNPKLIPPVIDIHELPVAFKNLPPRNPNMPNLSKGKNKALPGENGSDCDAEQEEIFMREEVLKPYLDKKSAIVGSVVMAATLASVLALNAASSTTGEHPVFYVTLPAAFLMFCWDVSHGWLTRKASQQIAEEGDKNRQLALAQGKDQGLVEGSEAELTLLPQGRRSADAASASSEKPGPSLQVPPETTAHSESGSAEKTSQPSSDLNAAEKASTEPSMSRATLESLAEQLLDYLRRTFPTTMAVFAHLPIALVPFAFAMFILVQALVSKHWIATFAYGWKGWVDKTGVVGAIAGMGFLSVILCNFAGTNIGTTILLSRVIQTWEEIHRLDGVQINGRTWWGTIYSMALGVNFGAFSTAFSASLAGLLWRDILYRKKIKVGSIEFARVNLPIISVAMVVGLTALIAQIYITRNGKVH